VTLAAIASDPSGELKSVPILLVPVDMLISLKMPTASDISPYDGKYEQNVFNENSSQCRCMNCRHHIGAMMKHDC
jgi:hypothetical protein